MQKKINLAIVAGFLLCMTPLVFAQNGTNSPYTRFGYGDLANSSFGAGRSMGGVGIGLRSSKQINPMNPASYSSMDSLTFLFDFGASAQLSWYDDGTNKQDDVNGNVEYMAMQFPLHRQIAMSIGLKPYSHVGYEFAQTKTSDGVTYLETFKGTGGLNQLYAGLSIDIWKKRLSIGTNLNYLFGTIDHRGVTTYASTGATSVSRIAELKVRDVNFDFGLQYVHPLSKTNRVVAGLTFSPKNRLNNDNYETLVTTETSIDTIKGKAYDLPQEYGLGLSFVKDNKLIIAADFLYQEWGKVVFADKNDEFQNRTKFAAGVEYIPNFYSRPYFNKVRYRAGVSYTNSYVKVNDNGYKEYGATLGLGFPMNDARSYVNVSFEYVKIKPDLKTMIDEDYLRMTISYTFNELWFFKRKVE